MYAVSLLIENLNNDLGGEVVSNVIVITDLKAITPEEIKLVAEKLCNLACDSHFMRREV